MLLVLCACAVDALDADETMIKRGVDADSISDGAGSSSGMPLLFTPGGSAYNEHIIHSAKALGQQLFVELPADERKAKLDSEVRACGVPPKLHW